MAVSPPVNTPTKTANGPVAVNHIDPLHILRNLPQRDSARTPAYHRQDWAHSWADQDLDCLDTRAEVLIEESLITTQFASSNPCRVSHGSWLTPWTKQRVTDARHIQIDHHVPVYEAHISGGHRWSPQQRTRFYNDTANLNALPAEVNQRKSAHSPQDWRPKDEAAWCAYASQWVNIKGKYQLSVTNAERKALAAMLRTC